MRQRDNDNEKQNKDDLEDVKSLIQGVSDEPYSLEDILAEYGTRRSTVRTAVPVHSPLSQPEGKVLAFPNQTAPKPPQEEPDANHAPDAPAQDQPEEAPQHSEPEEEAPSQDPSASWPDDAAPAQEESEETPDAESEEENAGVVEFPPEESLLSSLLKRLGKKADRYADQMFQESEDMDEEEIRRLEELIPGTDQEEEPAPPQVPTLLYRLLHRPRREEPMPPDTAPQQLARSYSKGLSGLRLRSLGIFLLAVAAIVQLVVPALHYVWLPPLDNYQLQVWIACGLLGIGLLLSADVLFVGLVRAFHGKIGMDTLSALSVIFTLADGVFLSVAQNREGQLPYTAAVLVGLFFLTHGTYHKKCGLRLACRTAAAAAEPYVLTLDEGKWNGRDTYCKWSGVPNGFGSQIQTDDGAQRIYRRYCPILLIACLLFSLLSSVAAGRSEQLLWCLSATFTAASAFGSALVYGRPFHKLTRRLSQTGAALAGWPGLAQTRKGDRVLITDGDLFPPGYVEFNGIKVFGDYSVERVLSYTATLIRDSGSGLTKLFHDLLRAQGGLFRQADHLCCYEGGGLSANIRGYQVLVGSAAFMNLMEIALPPGLNVKNAVFCAIDGELAGIFALNYTLPDGVFPSLDALLREKVGPVLATRDFNIIPAMLHQRFKLASDKMDFPPVERRRELSDPEQPHNPILTGVLCREGLVPYADTVVGARRLRRATRLGAVLTCVGSTVGVLLAYYLTAVTAFGSLSPLNLLIFLATWLLPVWFLTSWVPRY